MCVVHRDVVITKTVIIWSIAILIRKKLDTHDVIFCMALVSTLYIYYKIFSRSNVRCPMDNSTMYTYKLIYLGIAVLKIKLQLQLLFSIRLSTTYQVDVAIQIVFQGRLLRQ